MFIDFKKLDFKGLKTKLDFENGQVNVKPFNLKYEDITIRIGGSHGFDKSLAYNAVFQVPAKYLGSEVNQLLGKIDDDTVNQITIPITATIGGTLTSPDVSTDLTSGIADLTKQLIEIQKQKLLNKGRDEIKDIVKDIFNAGKPVAAICHAGWMLVSAGILSGKRATSFFAIKDDLINAGAQWVDQEVVVDENLITSRVPDDLPAFMKAVINMLQ